MRDAADDIDALVERAEQVLAACRITEKAVLREGDELDVDEGRHLALDLEQGVDGEQPIVGDVDMAADREVAARDRPAAEARAPGA